MDHLLLLASGKAYFDDDIDTNNSTDSNNGNSNEKETIVQPAAARRKRRPTDDLSDTERSTATQNTNSSSAATGADASKKAPSRSKRQKADEGDGDGEVVGERSSGPAEVTVKRKPGRPKKQQTGDHDTTDWVEPSVPTDEVKKKPGRPKKQKPGDDGEGDNIVDQDESSVPAAEVKKKPGRPKKQKAADVDDGTADQDEPSIPAEETKKKSGRPKKQKTVETEDGVDHTEEPKKILGRSKRQKADDDKEGEAEHSEPTVRTDKVRKKPGRPKKQTTSQREDGFESDELPTKEQKTKPGRPKKQRTDQETTDHVEAPTSAGPKRRQERPKKETDDVTARDKEESSTVRREVKTREGRTRIRKQHITVDDMQGNSSESDYRQYSKSESESDRNEDGNNHGDDSDDSGAQKKRKKPTVKERREMARVARVQERERRRQEKLDEKAAKSKAKEALKAKNQKRVRQSFLAIPVSVQLAHAAENMALQDSQQQPAENLEFPTLDRNSHGLIYQVLKPEQPGLTYRWPVREELLDPVPESSFASTTDELDDFEKYGLGFVEELTGVPKNEEDYSETDGEEDNAESNVDVQETSGQEDSEREQDGDPSAKESVKERAARRRREQYAARARKNALKGLLKREEPAARDQSERHEDERFANTRLEAVQALFEGEVARFAQFQYRKGILERIQDLEQFQKSTLPESCHQAVRAPIGSELPGFDQEDDLTRLQQRAIAFSAEDAVRKTLDRMTYVVRQGSLLRMPVKPRLYEAVIRNKYERGWDTVMTSAALAGIDDRILKKVSMRMQNLLSKSKNTHHYEAASEGKWMTVEDAIDRAKDPSRNPLQGKPHFVDPMDPTFDPRVLALNAKYRRHKENHAPVTNVKQQLEDGPAMISTTTRLGTLSPVLSASAGSSAESGSESGSVSGSVSGSASGTRSNSEGSASESGSGSEGESESSRNSDNDDADGSG